VLVSVNENAYDRPSPCLRVTTCRGNSQPVAHNSDVLQARASSSQACTHVGERGTNNPLPLGILYASISFKFVLGLRKACGYLRPSVDMLTK